MKDQIIQGESFAMFKVPTVKKIDHSKIKTIEDVALIFKHIHTSVTFYEGDTVHQEVKHLLEEDEPLVGPYQVIGTAEILDPRALELGGKGC